MPSKARVRRAGLGLGPLPALWDTARLFLSVRLARLLRPSPQSPFRGSRNCRKHSCITADDALE